MELLIKDGDKERKIEFAFDYTQVTVSSTVDDTIPEQWSKQVEDYVKPKRFMLRFVEQITELISKPGDTLHINRRGKLSADGDLTETTMLEGNEEKLSLAVVSYTPAERGNAVAFTGQAAAKSVVELRNEAITVLGDWAANKTDLDIHAALRTGVLSANISYGGNATTVYDIDATDTITPGQISKLKYEMEGADVPKFNAGDPSDPSAKNEGYYIMILHPYQIYDLTQHTDYKSVAQNAATISAMRAVGPLFQGFDAYWDGVLIYNSSNISFAIATAGYAVKIAKGFCFGPRAIGRAVGIFKIGPGFLWNEKTFDYGRSLGIALRWYDQTKILNSDRIWGVYTAATDLSA